MRATNRRHFEMIQIVACIVTTSAAAADRPVTSYYKSPIQQPQFQRIQQSARWPDPLQEILDLVRPATSSAGGNDR